MKAQSLKFTKVNNTIEILLSGTMLLYLGWLSILTSNTILLWQSGVKNIHYSLITVEFNRLISFAELTGFLFILSTFAFFSLIIGFTRFENAILKFVNKTFVIIGFLLLLFRVHVYYDFSSLFSLN
jgi:hypothetical protein